MKSTYRTSSALALATIALALVASPAIAQSAADPAAGEEFAPAEIVVTAQKRTERLQDVPVAVTALSGDKLDTQGGINLETAQTIIPTLNIQKSGTTLNQSIYMRGVGTATFSIAAEPSVSTVVDGVVYARAGEAFSDLVDIERLEVLRGPQGTLFGKNASAGAINIVTRRPGDKLAGSAELSYFDSNEVRGKVTLDAPLSENVRTRWVGFYTQYDGNIFNVAPNVNSRVNG